MSDRHAAQRENPFLTVPIGRLFLSNALPMTLVMSMSGVLNVVDGIFVGRFIGPEALAAVSLAFPAVMLLSALAALVGGGMSGLMARHLGAGDRAAAARVFAGAHGLALAMTVVLFGAWQTFGQAIVFPDGGGPRRCRRDGVDLRLHPAARRAGTGSARRACRCAAQRRPRGHDRGALGSREPRQHRRELARYRRPRSRRRGLRARHHCRAASGWRFWSAPGCAIGRCCPCRSRPRAAGSRGGRRSFVWGCRFASASSASRSRPAS